MIYENEPENFNPKFSAVGCFVKYNNEILLLHRQNYKAQGNTWGIPSGKIDEGENKLEAMVREVKEETGFKFPKSQIKYFQKVYVKFREYDFIYHIFSTKLDRQIQVEINKTEHKNSKWESPAGALLMPLIEDLDACIKLYYKI